MKKHRILAIMALAAAAVTACGIQEEGSLAPMQPGSVETTVETPAVTPELTSALGADGVLPESGTIGRIRYSLGGSGEDNECAERGYYVIYEDGAYHCIICQGEHSTGGYSIRIADLFTNADSAWKIVVEETSPGPTDCVTEAFTYPWCSITLSDLPADLVVENTNGVQFECLGLIKPDEPAETTEPTVLPEYQSVQDYAAYLTRTADSLKYSECPDDSGLLFCFDLLGSQDYLMIEQDGTEYLLLRWVYSDYGAVVDAVTGIDKNCTNGTLSLTVGKTIRQTGQSGCEPDLSYVSCILKLDEPVSSVTVDGQVYTPYAGGFVLVGEKWVVCGADLNMLCAPVWDGAVRLDHDYDDIPTLYRVWNEQGTGLLDEQFHEILPPKYTSVDYLAPDRYIVTKCWGNVRNSELSIVDGSGNAIYGSISGLLSGGCKFSNHAHQAIYMIAFDPEPPLYGVIDDELNIIIPAKYTDITMWSADTADQFYVVRNDAAEYAVFDTNGSQVTEFDNSSVYEVQTAYHEYLWSKHPEQ